MLALILHIFKSSGEKLVVNACSHSIPNCNFFRNCTFSSSNFNSPPHMCVCVCVCTLVYKCVYYSLGLCVFCSSFVIFGLGVHCEMCSDAYCRPLINCDKHSHALKYVSEKVIGSGLLHVSQRKLKILNLNYLSSGWLSTWKSLRLKSVFF